MMLYLVVHLGLDLMDSNTPGFSDDPLSNDPDADNHSVTKTKLTMMTSKDKKKTFFKKVNSLLISLERSKRSVEGILFSFFFFVVHVSR